MRGFNGLAILVTPPALRYFDSNDKVVPVFQDRNVVIKEVAAELQVYLIDLNTLSMDLLNQLGKSGSDYLWWGTEYLHFSNQGAVIIAGLVIQALPRDLQSYVLPR